MISIIVPVYNVEEYLDKCILSLCNQTYPEIEIILVDDGSNDQSGAICDAWAKRDDRIRVFHKQNEGVSASRNVGIDNAKGELICFVDSDDYISNQFLALMVRHCQTDCCKMVMCRFQRVDDSYQIEENQEFVVQPRERSAHDVLLDIYSIENEQTIVTVNKLYRRELFEGVRFPVGEIHEDEAVIPLLIHKAGSVVVLDCALYYYLTRKGSITHSSWSNQRLDYLKVLIERIAFAEANFYEEFADKTRIEYCLAVSFAIKKLRQLDASGNKELIQTLKQNYKMQARRCEFIHTEYACLRKFAIRTSRFIPIIWRVVNKLISIIQRKG